jgi:8-oxo-dGTP pyrophosphatase MutT (NUDIX family)
MQVLVYPVRQRGATWEYLLLRRVPARGRFWQGVTGGLEKDERLVDAAKRELYEETKFVPLKLEKIDFSYSLPVAEEWKHLYAPDVKGITEYVFVAYVEAGREPVLDRKEHDLYTWCGVDKALQLLKWPENKEALNQVAALLAAQATL